MSPVPLEPGGDGPRLPVALLVVAKAPIAGFAKTRLTPPLSARDAARVAAASLLDTLAAVRATPVRHRVVAWTGNLADVESRDEIATALADFTVLPQRGGDFGVRLANAHADCFRFADAVLQIGMDTPQVDAALLTACAARLLDNGAVLGPATDGGWWALGLTDPRPVRALAEVPMSTARTGELTRNALCRQGCAVAELPGLTDVDTFPDALSVSALCHGRFRETVRRLESAGVPA